VLEVFTNADMDRYMDTRKSTISYLYTFARVVISWVSRLQRVIALSKTDAEYIAATEAFKEMLWMQQFLGEIEIKKDKYVLYCDSQSAIDMPKNSKFHKKIQAHCLKIPFHLTCVGGRTIILGNDPYI